MSSALTNLTKEDLIERLDVLQDIAVKFLSKEDRSNILEFLLQKSMELCPCDGGTLYLLNKDMTKLNFEIMVNQTYSTDAFKTVGIPLVVRSMATHCFIHKNPLAVSDVYLLDNNSPFKFNDTLDQKMNYRTKSMITFPLLRKDGQAMGVIQPINRKNYLKEEWPTDGNKISAMPEFSKADQEMLNRLTSLTEASLENWYYPSEDVPDLSEDEILI